MFITFIFYASTVRVLDIKCEKEIIKQPHTNPVWKYMSCILNLQELLECKVKDNECCLDFWNKLKLHKTSKIDMVKYL